MVNYFPYLLNYLSTQENFPLDAVIPELKPLYSFANAYKYACLGNLQQSAFFLQGAKDSPFINPYSLKQHKLTNPSCYDNLFLSVNNYFFPSDIAKHALNAIILETKNYINPDSNFVENGNKLAREEIDKALSFNPNPVYKFYKAFISRDFDNNHYQLIKEYYKHIENNFLSYYQPLFDLTFYHLSFLNISDVSSTMVALVSNFIAYNEIDLLSEGVSKISSHLPLNPLAFTDLYFASRDLAKLIEIISTSYSFTLEQSDHATSKSIPSILKAEKELEKHGRQRQTIALRIMLKYIKDRNTEEFYKEYYIMRQIHDVAFKDYLYYLYKGSRREIQKELCKLEKEELAELCNFT
ncbi:hypothetical protein SJAV_01110 [Sulfurisphaera javensis]|uniref:Uncharacterized protein n=1 Tax=Sulfurisphaera javensis TaxID=2049879 RepID=A0AAT9GMR8_9CREN